MHFVSYQWLLRCRRGNSLRPKKTLWTIQLLQVRLIIMKSTEFKLPEKELESEAEQHAEETRRAVSAASKGQQPMRKKQPGRGKGLRQ